jgi:membrane protein DedA with SNARE-associated domain
MESSFLDYLKILGDWSYVMVFIGMIVEGDIVLFAASFLAYQGYFDLVRLAPVVFSGVLIGDSIWYSLGDKFKSENSIIHKWVEHVAEPFDEHVQVNPLRSIFISKFAYGFHHAILMRAGALRIHWLKIFKSDIIATIFWGLIVGGVGYASAATFLPFKRYLKYGEIALFLALVGFWIVSRLISTKTKRRL